MPLPDGISLIFYNIEAYTMTLVGGEMTIVVTVSYNTIFSHVISNFVNILCHTIFYVKVL